MSTMTEAVLEDEGEMTNDWVKQIKVHTSRDKEVSRMLQYCVRRKENLDSCVTL